MKRKVLLTLACATCMLNAYGQSPALPKPLTEEAVVIAVGQPVIKKVTEEDSPGCMVTRYHFAEDVLGLKLEFKCSHTSVAWLNAPEPEYAAQVEAAAAQAQRAVMALTGGTGIEVEKALHGDIFRGKTFQNGLSLSGSCSDVHCVLTFR